MGWRPRYGLPGKWANLLVTLRAIEVAQLELRDDAPSHAAAVLFHEGLAVDESVVIRAAAYEGKRGYEILIPAGIWLSYEEYEWILRKTREAHERAGSKPTRDPEVPNPHMSEEGKSV